MPPFAPVAPQGSGPKMKKDRGATVSKNNKRRKTTKQRRQKNTLAKHLGLVNERHGWRQQQHSCINKFHYL